MRTHCDHSRFGNFVESLGAVKLPIPPSTLFVGAYRHHAIAALILAAVICGFITWRRMDRQSTLIVNLSGIVLALGWGTLQTSALYQAAMTILEGMPPRG